MAVLKGQPLLFFAPAEGTLVNVLIDGEAGGQWVIEKRASGWSFCQRVADRAATLRISHQDAWKIFTKGISFDDALKLAQIDGDVNLAQHGLRLVAVMG